MPLNGLRPKPAALDRVVVLLCLEASATIAELKEEIGTVETASVARPGVAITAPLESEREPLTSKMLQSGRT